MSGNPTEQPTPRRLREARRRGDAPVSQQLTGAASLVAGMIALGATSDSLARALAHATAAALVQAVGSGRDTWRALLCALILLGRALVPVAAAILFAALAAGALQTRGLFSIEVLRPRLDRIQVGKGLSRLWSAERLRATALEMLKAAAALLAAWRLVLTASRRIAAAPRLEVRALPSLLQTVVTGVGMPLGGLLLAFGALDLALARRRYFKRLMMSREEVARERRDDEGDPSVDAERRRLHRALAATVPLKRATCLVVNPAHLAVALYHPQGADDAPIVVAKGRGQAAARLRVEARRAGIPIVQDIALARALFRLAEVGDEIPEELYDAAAAVLVHVHGLPAESPR